LDFRPTVVFLRNFISECGFGGIRKSAPIKRLVCSTPLSAGFVMSELSRDERFLICIGTLAVAWATTELLLDALIGTLFHEFGGHPSEPTLPRTGLARKITFAKACFNTNAELSKDRDEAVPMLDQMLALGEDRHWCIHGAALNLHKGNEPLLQTRYRFRDNTLFTEEKPISIEIVADLATRTTWFSGLHPVWLTPG
jgi:hypothetical protein